MPTRPPTQFKDRVRTAQLWRAVRENQADAVTRLIRDGADPNDRQPPKALKQTTVVEHAIEHDAAAALVALLQNGARLARNRSLTGAHRAAREGKWACVSVLQRARRMGPLFPLDENMAPPLFHALMGGNSRTLPAPNPSAECGALVDRWLSTPLKWPATNGLCETSVLEAALLTRPPEFLDRLLAGGLNPRCIPADKNPLINAAGWLEAPAVGPTVHETMAGWIRRLAQAGLEWPLEAQSAGRGRAVYDEARLELGVGPRSPAPRRLRL